jgi:D-serine deaminase-like pyridoxal phosphate-dependent protein
LLSPEVVVAATNQEHGILARRDGEPLGVESFTIGRRLRILPNHACATAGQFEECWLVGGKDGERGRLERCRGW